MGEEDEYAELFVSSWKFVGAFLAPLVAAILGTAALLAHVALWLVIPFAISFVFLWIFVRNQEKAMKQLRNKNRPYLDDNKD
jgi:nitrate/nitrite transporter NarK